MPDTIREALDFIRDLGTPEELEEEARRRSAPPGPRPHNTHIHLPPNFSAFDNLEQIADGAAREGLALLGASNYYFYEIYGPFASLLFRRGIFPLFGLEVIALLEDLQRQGLKINDHGNPGRMYLCGKGARHLEPVPPEAGTLLETIRRNDGDRMRRMTARMEEIFRSAGIPTGLDDAAVKERVRRRHGCPPGTVVLQERHVARAFQERFFDLIPPGLRAERLRAILRADPSGDGTDPVRTQNDLRTHLMKAGKPAFVEEKFLGFEESLRLILQLGAIPCYPVLADGARPVCPFEDPPERLAGALRERGLYCVEFIPVRNRPEVLERYVLTLRKAGFVVTAGTEHNTLDRIPLAPACAGGAPLPAGLPEIFWEGACVAVAHLFLGLHQRCGYVDAQGRLNERYDSPDARIGALSRLGAAVIERCRRRNRSSPA